MSKVLRASRAGFPCERNLWYSVHGYAGTTDESAQRIFDVGTYLEPLVVEWLRKDGWEVEYNPGSQSAELEVKIAVKGGEISGHPDCIISRGELRNVLVDIKTMNERSYTLWKREGTLKSKPQYADQVHIYAHGLKESGRAIEHVGIVGVNKNNSEMHIEIFDYDSERMTEILSRAERVLNAESVPTENSPRESWCCRYCEYEDICGLQARPKPAELDAEVEETNSEPVITAMRMLMSSRTLAKESRELESQAKKVLEEHIKESGKTKIHGGGVLFSLTERKRSVFDSTGFKKDYPDLALKYMKESASLMYEVKEVI